MRTTIRLDDHLLSEVKQLAARTGRTFTAIVEDALMEVVRRAKTAPKHRRIKLPTFGGGGVKPGVDLSDNAGVRALMDAGRPLEKLR
jgi:hypothetical protein